MKTASHKLLGFIPCLLAALGLAAFVFILRAETAAYQHAVETWAEHDLSARTQLASEAIHDALTTGDFARLRTFADARRADGLRLTVLTQNGGMVFDSDSRASGSRSGCPEVIAAREKGIGTALRKSTTTGGRHLYCARRTGDEFIVRLALPYETVVEPLRANRPALFLASLVGASGILLVLLFTFHLVARNRVLARERDVQNRLLEEARRLAEFRRDFIANVSHEIKTPLTGILGAVDLLNGPESDMMPHEDRQTLLGMLHRESTRLDALARDILALARLEQDAQNQTLVCTPTDLADLLTSATDRVRPRAEKAGISLLVEPTAPLVLSCDARLIEQALVNLADNAIRHSGTTELSLALKPTEDGAVFTVTDHGIGIAPADQARLFERFYRVDKSHNRDVGGTGLGLAIVKHIAQCHGGDVSLSSEPGKGSTFTLTLKRERNKE